MNFPNHYIYIMLCEYELEYELRISNHYINIMVQGPKSNRVMFMPSLLKCMGNATEDPQYVPHVNTITKYLRSNVLAQQAQAAQAQESLRKATGNRNGTKGGGSRHAGGSDTASLKNETVAAIMLGDVPPTVRSMNVFFTENIIEGSMENPVTVSKWRINDPQVGSVLGSLTWKIEIKLGVTSPAWQFLVPVMVAPLGITARTLLNSMHRITDAMLMVRAIIPNNDLDSDEKETARTLMELWTADKFRKTSFFREAHTAIFCLTKDAFDGFVSDNRYGQLSHVNKPPCYKLLKEMVEGQNDFTTMMTIETISTYKTELNSETNFTGVVKQWHEHQVPWQVRHRLVCDFVPGQFHDFTYFSMTDSSSYDDVGDFLPYFARSQSLLHHGQMWNSGRYIVRNHGFGNPDSETQRPEVNFLGREVYNAITNDDQRKKLKPADYSIAKGQWVDMWVRNIHRLLLEFTPDRIAERIILATGHLMEPILKPVVAAGRSDTQRNLSPETLRFFGTLLQPSLDNADASPLEHLTFDAGGAQPSPMTSRVQEMRANLYDHVRELNKGYIARGEAPLMVPGITCKASDLTENQRNFIYGGGLQAIIGGNSSSSSSSNSGPSSDAVYRLVHNLPEGSPTGKPPRHKGSGNQSTEQQMITPAPKISVVAGRLRTKDQHGKGSDKKEEKKKDEKKKE